MKKKSTKPKETLLQIKFANEAAAEHFVSWLSGAGEQDYWLWMECREEMEGGDITAVEFDYHSGDGSIGTICGRLDGDDVTEGENAKTDK